MDRGVTTYPTDPPPRAEGGVWLACFACEEPIPPFAAPVYACPTCGGLLEVRYASLPSFDDFRRVGGGGVWRYRDALPLDAGVSIDEGDTPLLRVPSLETELGLESLRIKHEGMNPTGSFKDRGMTVGVGVARRLGLERLACASTGNTSAALAAYGARAGMETIVLLPAGKVASGKLAQASIHGARILEVDGNFDDCLAIVGRLAETGLAYLLNSTNPYRLEGQKTIGYEILEACLETDGAPPDRICLPVGNAGNTAALYKAFRELVTAGALDPDEIPTLTAVQAAGAAPFVEAFAAGASSVSPWDEVETTATAIRIGNPVNAPKALPGVRATGGTAVAVADAEIEAAQGDLAREGIGVEPASAAGLAGLRRLREDGEVAADERVVCLTTGDLLKDPEAARRAGTTPEPVSAEYDAVVDLLT